MEIRHTKSWEVLEDYIEKLIDEYEDEEGKSKDEIEDEELNRMSNYYWDNVVAYESYKIFEKDFEEENEVSKFVKEWIKEDDYIEEKYEDKIKEWTIELFEYIFKQL